MSIGQVQTAACGACLETEDLLPFTMAFQPVVDIQTRQIVAHEALVRGVNGEGADVVLSQITSKNRYAFDQACRVCAIELASSLGLTVTLNINFLPNAVYQPEACIQSTLRVAQRTGFPLDRITFEIVEQEDVVDPDHLRRIVSAYNDFGFKVALDDFGSGYSGLSRLAELKPDIVKIDRALINNCSNEVWRLQIITSMVELCQKLSVKIVAEGVENASEAETLRRAGVRFMQGFYFARPAFQSLVSPSDIVWPGLMPD
jgi:EAL domain-containing protein (putative c-di-GMP-specific phosphodiesterase class I)